MGRSPAKPVNEKTRLTTRDSSSSREEGERSIQSSIDSLTPQEDMCGWGSWNPARCQSLNNSRWILFFFCTMACVQGMIMNGYSQTVVSTIEKRYNLRSLATGFILSTNDMAICLSLIPISYLGANKNKCTLIAAGALLFSIGCLVFSSPHFFSGRYHLSESQDDSVYDIHLCNNTISQPEREKQFCQAFTSGHLVGDTASWTFMAIFIIGRFLQGVGTTTLFLLAVVYIDENNQPATSSFHMGMFYGTSLLGPTIGYLLGAALLRLYVDFGRAENPAELSIDSDNPLWVGAWWIGFLIGALVSLIVAIPISMYPKQLPSYAEVNAKKRSEVQHGVDDNESSKPAGFESTFRDLPRATYLLLQNGVYTCIVLNNGFDAMIAVGLAAFFPKFLEAQLNLLPSSAAIAAAVIGIPSAGVGTILGGWIVKRFNMSCDQILSFCKWTTLLGILVLPAFLVPCDNVTYPGINAPYPVDNSQANGLKTSCNSDCSCIDEEYYPVCGSDDRQYFSPCHAGCKAEVVVNGEKIYVDCGCITPLATDQSRLILDNLTEVDATYAEVGTCMFVCKARYFLLIGMFAIIFITCLPFVPSKAVLLRVVPGSQRSLAMGVRWIVSCLLGSIPGPILVGYLMDSTCVFWKRECDRSDHTCLLYDAKDMRKFCFVLALSFKFSSLLFIFGASKLYKPPTTPQNNPKSKETTNLK